MLGVFTEFNIPTASSLPLQIAAGPDGNLWFTEFAAAGDKIGRVILTGGVTELPLPSPNEQPSYITAGPDGNLWFAEVAGNKIGHISP